MNKIMKLSSCYRLSFTFILFWIHLGEIINLSEALCQPLPDESWDGLKSALQSAAGGNAFLCPFTIQGAGCPTEEDHISFGEVFELQAEMELYIVCHSFTIGYEDKCVIDCPETHFKVPPHARLELDRFTFQGSSNGPAIHVEPYGELALYNSNLQNNGYVGANGGAIYAEQYSRVELSNCLLESNTANCGGALYTLGFSEIVGSTFKDNKAVSSSQDEGGGAIYIGQGAVADITNSVFRGNEANYLGPALLDQSNHHGKAVASEENTACHNQVITTGSECNGNHVVFNRPPGATGLSSGSATIIITGASCLEFENACSSSSLSDLEVGLVSQPSQLPLLPAFASSSENPANSITNEQIFDQRNSEALGPSPEISDSSDDYPASASCLAHPNCYGLEGNCCPSPEGAILFCCEGNH